MVMEYMDHDFRSLMESMTRPFRTSEARPSPSPHTRADNGIRPKRGQRPTHKERSRVT